jgi:uncharacterized repeat protein (TIGR03809 family)
MTQRTDQSRGRDIIARWCVLAEQRLDYLTELFETGRWRRYHSEEAFLENIREAKAAVETWHVLMTREATLGYSPIDISWLGRTGVISPPLPKAERTEMLGFEPPPVVPEPLYVAPPIAAEPEPVVEEEVLESSEDDALAQTVALTLDIVAMQERYPLLRNAR